MKWCKTCGRPKHKGICDMATLSNGRIVHVNRVKVGGDLHELLGEKLKVVNMWIKREGKKNVNAASD